MHQNNTPKHVAIICDGNRRWAKEHKLEVMLGHQKAVDDVIEPLVERASKRGVEFITFWVFSTENWNRDKREVDALLQIFRQVLDRRLESLHKNGVKIKVIGDIASFPKDIQEKVAGAIEKTKENKKITVILALNYGGRDELLRMVNKVVAESDGNSKVTADDIEKHLETAGIPDPDFIIRTSGEQRLSGFMLWQSNYAELAFPDFYFPEFSPDRLDELLEDFANRRRRFGV